MKRRVVITACSALTPIGYGKDAIVDSLRQGRSGVKPLRDDGLLTGHIHSRVFGTVDYPIAYEAAKALVAAAACGCHDFAVQWAGQGAPLARAMPAAELVETLARELGEACPQPTYSAP